MATHYVFESKATRLDLQITPSKKLKNGSVKKGKEVKFEGHSLITSDKVVAETIMATNMFRVGDITLHTKTDDAEEAKPVPKKQAQPRGGAHRGAVGTS